MKNKAEALARFWQIKNKIGSVLPNIFAGKKHDFLHSRKELLVSIPSPLEGEGVRRTGEGEKKIADKKILTTLKGYPPLYGSKTSPTRRAEVQDDKDCRSEELLVSEPSPEFLTFATARVEILPSHKERGGKFVQSNDEKILNSHVMLNLFQHLAIGNSLRQSSALPQGARERIAVEPSRGDKKIAFTLAEGTPYGGMLPTFAKAFTLAEVLITLGIIGIVAAMTLPSLFTHIQKVQYAAKIKKVYSMLGQAEKKAQDNGCYSANGMNTLTWFKTYLAPELKVAEYTTMSKLKQKYHIQYKQLSGGDETALTSMRDSAYVVILQDGTLLFLSNYVLGESTEDKDFGASITFDVNGLKLPNQFGKDTFILLFNEDKGGVVPLGYGSLGDDTFGEQYDREKIKSGGPYRYGCNKNQRGMWCLALFVADGFKFARDYPW